MDVDDDCQGMTISDHYRNSEIESGSSNVDHSEAMIDRQRDDDEYRLTWT